MICVLIAVIVLELFLESVVHSGIRILISDAKRDFQDVCPARARSFEFASVLLTVFMTKVFDN